MLAAVEDFIDERVGAAAFLLIGESYGGYLAPAIVDRRPEQVLGLCLICPAGRVPERSRRTVPPHTVLVHDPDLVASLDPAAAAEFTENTVAQSKETLRRFQDEVMSGADLADQAAMERIQQRSELSAPPESGAPYQRPALIFTGRQDSAIGYADTCPLLDHYPRATFAILDRAGHNLQIEQPAPFQALVAEWLDRVAEAGQPGATPAAGRRGQD